MKFLKPFCIASVAISLFALCGCASIEEDSAFEAAGGEDAYDRETNLETVEGEELDNLNSLRIP